MFLDRCRRRVREDFPKFQTKPIYYYFIVYIGYSVKLNKLKNVYEITGAIYIILLYKCSILNYITEEIN